jgi:biotin carboxylase
VPTIRRAQALGLRVFVTDGYAERPGYAVADAHEVADVTDPDATLAAARRRGVNGVLCDTTDMGVVVAATVADRLGLPGVGLEAARNCTDKARMTACAAAAGLTVPASVTALSSDEALAAAASLPGPWVVKPVDNQSGRGVAIVYDATALPAAVRQAQSYSRCGRLIVQQLVQGIEIIVDSLVVGGKVHLLGIAAKTPYPENPTVSSRITYGVAQLLQSEGSIAGVNAKLLSALGVRQGLVHAEYILAGGCIVPIDVAARGGGVLIYPVVLPHVSGVDAMRAAIDLALGRTPVVEVLPSRRGANIEFLRGPPGRIEAIEGLEEARAMPGVAAIHLNQQVGALTGTLNHKDERLGYVVTLAGTADEATILGQRAAKAIRVHVS